MRRLSRRGFLGIAGGVGAALAVPGCASLLGEVQTGQLLRSKAKLPRPFTVPLPIPKVAEPTRRSGGAQFFDLTAREAKVEILPGLKTSIFGYDGTFPGPTLVSRRDQRTVVRHVNDLPVPTVAHLHGGHTPPASDGFPVDLVLPEGYGKVHGKVGNVAHGSRQYVYPMRQRAATLWYHDHRMDFTGPQVYRGLAGFHLVHDDEEDALPLPDGDRDIPLMICDRAFDEDGTFMYPSLDPELRGDPGVQDAYMKGVLGDVVLVNGAPWPELEVSATTYRFRILNASNARRYQLALEPKPRQGTPFVQIASDGGLLPGVERLDDIVIAPAERFDVLVDFSAFPVGSTVKLVNGLARGDGTADVMRFRITKKAKGSAPRLPAKLSDFERLRPEQAKVTRKFRFGRDDLQHHSMWTINGKLFDPKRMDARPRLGQVERWRFVTDLHHPVHVHLDSFQVLRDKDYDKGWKDTVDIRPGEVVDVLVRFADYTGPYVFHCHNLEHEDMAMMAAFETVG